MNGGGLTQWNAIAICEMSKISWKMGKLCMNEDLGNLSKDYLFHLVHWWNTSQIPRDKGRSSSRKEIITRNLTGMCFDRGEEEVGKETFWLLILKN